MLRLFKNSHNTKFRVVAISLMPQHVVVIFSAQLVFSMFELNICTSKELVAVLKAAECKVHIKAYVLG